MNCIERLETYLREQKVPFHIEHHPVAYTAHEVAVSEQIPDEMMVKVVMVVADDQLTMLAIPASHRVNLDKVEALLKPHEIHLASEREFATTFADCEVGAMPPFGNLYQVPVYVDRSLAADETIVFQAGTHTDTMRMPYASFAQLVQPRLGEFADRMM